MIVMLGYGRETQAWLARRPASDTRDVLVLDETEAEAEAQPGVEQRGTSVARAWHEQPGQPGQGQPGPALGAGQGPASPAGQLQRCCSLS